MILDPGGKLYLPEMVIELMVYLRRDIVVFVVVVVVVLLLSGTPDQQNKDHNIYNVTNK